MVHLCDEMHHVCFKQPTNLIAQGIHANIVEICGEPGTTHGDQSNSGICAKLVSPGPAPYPVDAVLTGIGSIKLACLAAPPHNPQVRPLSGRAHDSVAVTREAV